MRALVIFESMYGATRAAAEHVADGLTAACDVVAVPVGEATEDLVAAADLLVIGAPTHVHGMPSGRSRQAARDAVSAPGSDLVLDQAAAGPGVREWLESAAPGHERPAAAFDTRLRGPRALTGHASGGIDRRLRRRGYRVLAPAESFLVGKDGRLLDGELDRARSWGRELAVLMGPLGHTGARSVGRPVPSREP